jgi:predicted NodU family carbamoyl transferase
MKDGKLLYVLHEEKFDNVKNSDNFPIKALEYLAKKEDLSDLDSVAVVGKAINRRMLRYIPNYTKDSKHKIINFEVTVYDRILYFLMKFFPRFMNRVNDFYMRIRKIVYTKKYIELIQQGIGRQIPKEKVIFVSHHECHTLSVIYFYGLHQQKEPVLVFTMDG